MCRRLERSIDFIENQISKRQAPVIELILGEFFMTNVIDSIDKIAQEIDPNAPLTKAAVAIGQTIVDPTPESILSDVMLAIQLVKDVKAKLGNAHPSVIDIFKALL